MKIHSIKLLGLLALTSLVVGCMEEPKRGTTTRPYVPPQDQGQQNGGGNNTGGVNAGDQEKKDAGGGQTTDTKTNTAGAGQDDKGIKVIDDKGNVTGATTATSTFRLKAVNDPTAVFMPASTCKEATGQDGKCACNIPKGDVIIIQKAPEKVPDRPNFIFVKLAAKLKDCVLTEGLFIEGEVAEVK